MVSSGGASSTLEETKVMNSQGMAQMSSVDSLAASLLSATLMFDRASLLALEALAAESDRRVLRRGEVLVREGDASDRFFIVLSGRFTVHKGDSTGSVAEIAQGELIGEIGFFAGLPRMATVLAARDSIVLEIGRNHFEKAAETLPSQREAVTVFLARRFATQSPRSSRLKEPAKIRTLAIIAAGGSRISPVLIQHLRHAFGAATRARFVSRLDVQAKFPGLPIDDQPILNWLNELEAEAQFIVYVADEEPNEWTQVCIRQADTVLLLASASCSPRLNPSEELTLSVHPPSTSRLVLIHDTRSAAVSGTSAWLDERPYVDQHHHVALDDGSDFQRLVRFISGKALGFVAAGGGSLGSAHLGVYKAFVEAGACFDYLGGTSSGAAMMAGFARGLDADQIDRGTHNIFIKSRAFRRPTLPHFALLDHKAFDRALRLEYGDVLIEDLWLPFFALSTNLSSRQPHVHRRGKLWHAVRASGSIPGVLPPFFTDDGDMLVDGAIMNNLPLEQMKELKTGPNVIVTFGSSAPQKYDIDYDRIPGASELALALLNPFGRARLPRVPSMLQVIASSMLAHRPQDIAVGEEDILICPEVSNTISFMDWSRHSELFSDAYDRTTRWIEEQNDSGLRAVLGTAHD
ncbi:MAG: cyclic nucleotide-binding domain-containing protein [Mesorhizobium sp.]|uniref:patatin-like phospholipase family protein n=1 Tax=Mesorhizobium sp. TaxID=1871066 RepID=UPI00122214CB|nr:patatin-like phospholipase family protein [Mesorhizobium sp.]TIL62845.1 MAG: cyclic nucleotide-binding domain-containing protein [Mesorhizobium sp.]